MNAAEIPNQGLYLYGGWYYFIGKIVKHGKKVQIGGLGVQFATHFPRPPVPFTGQSVLALEFDTHIPWVLDEPRPDSALTLK